MKLIDLTHTFKAKMPVFPGDTPPTLYEEKDEDNDIIHYQLKSSMHVGTHMDGPLHMITKGGRKLSEIDVKNFIAPGHLLDARDRREIGTSLLNEKNINPGDCVLVYTGYGEKFGEPTYFGGYPHLTEEFARKLVELKVKFIGLDTPSPDHAPYRVHRILLEKEILVIENMCNLSKLLNVKDFEVIALPTKFEAEAAPVRVVARVE